MQPVMSFIGKLFKSTAKPAAAAADVKAKANNAVVVASAPAKSTAPSKAKQPAPLPAVVQSLNSDSKQPEPVKARKQRRRRAFFDSFRKSGNTDEPLSVKASRRLSSLQAALRKLDAALDAQKVCSCLDVNICAAANVLRICRHCPQAVLLHLPLPRPLRHRSLYRRRNLRPR